MEGTYASFIILYKAYSDIFTILKALNAQSLMVNFVRANCRASEIEIYVLKYLYLYSCPYLKVDY